MFTPLSRIILLLLCAVLSVIAAILGIYSLLFLTCLASILLLYGYYRKGSVSLALNRVRNEDYKEADRILGYTTHPERLDKRQKTYYLFVKGFIARENNNFEEAIALLEEALAEGIKKENDRAMALLALADIYMIKHNRSKAQECLIRMKGLKVAPALMPGIRKMQEWVQQ